MNSMIAIGIIISAGCRFASMIMTVNDLATIITIRITAKTNDVSACRPRAAARSASNGAQKQMHG